MKIRYTQMKCAGPAPSKRTGFTLVELMVAVVVMSILALGASAFVVRSYSQLMKAKEMESAAMLANNAMEMFMGTTITNFPLSMHDGDVHWLVYEPATANWSNTRGTRYSFKGFQSPVADQGVVPSNRPDTMTTANIPNYPAEVVTQDGQDYYIVTRAQRFTRNVFSQAYFFTEVVVTVAWERGWIVLRSRRES